MTNQLLRRVIRAALEPGRDSSELVLSAGADISGLNYAFREGIHTLYKFKPFTTAFDEEVVRQILVDNEIYFARADQLNDKTELQIRHEITGDKSDPATRAALLADLERLMREDSRSESFIRAQLKALETIDLQRAEDEATRMSRERLRLEFPVFSLATKNTEALHWKEYAADFTGLCIHFDATSFDTTSIESPFAVARRVEYMPARPTIPIPLNIEATELARRVGLTKPLSYIGEIEYRLVVSKGYSAGIRITGQQGKFDGRHIVGVTIGENMCAPQIAKVVAMAQRRNPAIPMSIARRTPAGIQISQYP
jgi:hypothetical protein